MNEAFTTPALVLAGSPHGNLGIVRSLGRLGVPVYLVHNAPGSPASRSRYCREAFEWDFAAASKEDTVAYLLELGRKIGQHCFLFPTCDENAILASSHCETLMRWYLFPQQPPGLAASLASKKEMYFLAKKHEIPTPAASFPRTMDDVVIFSRTACFPVMVKGIDGARLKRALGCGVAIAESAAHLLSIYSRLEARDHSNLMLQEYIPGRDDTVWMFNGYFNSTSDCLFGVTGKKIRQYPAYTGATSLGVCLANNVVWQTTVRWMKQLGYRGVLDIGYRYDARDGQYKVLDVNPRIGATFRLFVGTDGMDVARAMYRDLTGQSVAPSASRERRKWIVEDCDLGSSLRYRRDKKMTIPQWARSLAGIEEAAYFALDDPLPFWKMCTRSIKWKTKLLRGEERAVLQIPTPSIKVVQEADPPVRNSLTSPNQQLTRGSI